jgi:hypothetical protein
MFLEAGALRQMTADLIRHEHLLLADHAKGAAQVQQLQFAVSQAQFVSDTLRKDLASVAYASMLVYACHNPNLKEQNGLTLRNMCEYAGTA